MPFNPRHSPPKNAKLELSPEERDQRTLLIMQIARDTRPRDLEEFFSSVGAVRDVRIITDSRTGRSKGICYVEFWDEVLFAIKIFNFASKIYFSHRKFCNFDYFLSKIHNFSGISASWIGVERTTAYGRPVANSKNLR